MIEFKTNIDLALEYANNNNKVLIYKHSDYYSEDVNYDNDFGFFNFTNLEDFIYKIYEYLKLNGDSESIITIDYPFYDKKIELILGDNINIEIINCDKNNNISFLNMENIFMETYIELTKKENYMMN